jgi:protein-tyrosine phosphatase
MTKIWDRIYLGSLKDAQQLAHTNPCGIATVLSLCQDAVRQSRSISYVHLPIPDSRAMSATTFEEIMEVIEQAVRRGTLLVHCVGGMSRSPIVVAAWMQRSGYAGIHKALAEIAELRDIDPSPVLLASVKEHIR